MCEVTLEVLLPQLAAVQVDEMVAGEGLIRVAARTREEPVACPDCGQVSDWEHSRYLRHVADEAIGGRPLRIDLSVRRLYCENPACPRRTFAEQVEGLTVRYQRRTPALQGVVNAVAIALAGKAGARLLTHLHQTLSWATLLNCLMALPDPAAPTPSVLAVDDFALRKGTSYGTLLVDAETRLPIELWNTRDAAPLTNWLAAHPGIEVVCRDGSLTFASAIGAGAPKALQVSDRFHLWQGLGRKVAEVVSAHRADLVPPQAADTSAPDPEPVAAQKARHHYNAVHALLEQGVTLREIARRLPLDRNRVRRYARAASWQETVPTWPRHPGIIAPYRGYLRQRWEEGEHSPTALHREITERGFTGCYNTVMYYCRTLRDDVEASRGAPQQALSPRQAARLMLTRPDHLHEDGRLALKDLLTRCPALATVHDRVRAFGEMLTTGSADRLEQWIEDVKGDGIGPMTTYATGVTSDFYAVHAGILLPHNSGVIEGRVTDLKLIKRQMGGRAGISLLRKRVILVAHSRRTRTTDTTVADDIWTINAHQNLG